jgi:hypothetical protein
MAESQNGETVSLTPKQWADAGECALRAVFEAEGEEVPAELIQEARGVAVWIATGQRLEREG